MNLYQIHQHKVAGYDTYDAAVVVAETSEEAANMHPRDGKPLGSHRDGSWPVDPKHVSVECLGTANRDLGPGVVLASFNAG